MLAEGGTERQVEKRPNLTTSKNTERQKVLPPSASDCHSLPKWLSSPSRIRTGRDSSGNHGFPQEGGPKSGPIGGGRHRAAPARTESTLESLAAQLASLSPEDWAALLGKNGSARDGRS